MTATAAPGRDTAPRPAGADERGFRADIEGLRAVAVLAVVLNHADVPGMSGGYVGVDVFFVISGYLITRQLHVEYTTTGTVSLIRFYARRAKRLLPLGALVSLVTLAACWWVMSPLRAGQVGMDAMWASLGAMNIHLGISGVDYFAPTEPSPLQHYWSLAVEEQFYLLWAPVLLLTARMTRVGLGRSRAVGLLAVAGGLAIASFAAGVASLDAPSIAYFMPWTRAWELMVGAALALSIPVVARLPRGIAAVASIAGLTMVVVSCVVYDEHTVFPGFAALVPVLGTAVVIAAGVGGPTSAERLMRGAVVQLTGRLSYGLYLWHWPVLVLLPVVLGREPGMVERLAAVVLSIWLAAVSFVAVEDPIRGMAAFSSRPSNALLMGACLTVVTLVAGLGLGVAAAARGVSGGGAAAASPATASEVALAIAAVEHDPAVPSNLRPALADAAGDKPRTRPADGISCHVGLRDTDISRKPGGSCAFGEPAGELTVVLVGDSHAYQWFPALERIALDRGWRLVNMTKSACVLFDVRLIQGNLKRDYTECYAWREAAHARIVAEQPDLVVTSGAIFTEREGDFGRRWVEGVSTTVQRLRASTGAAVILIEDTPFPRRDIPQCVADNLRDVTPCSISRDRALSDPQRRVGQAEAARRAGAEVIDPVPWLCTDVCPPIIGDMLVYHDNSHISATYSAHLAGLLAGQLDAIDDNP